MGLPRWWNPAVEECAGIFGELVCRMQDPKFVGIIKMLPKRWNGTDEFAIAAGLKLASTMST